MALKNHSAQTPGRRYYVSVANDGLAKNEPVRRLTKGKNSSAGRNSAGRISVRRRGGGHKRKYRVIDFRRDKVGIPGTIRQFEYDPNRSARIALVVYADGDQRYIIAPKGLTVGASVMSGESAEPRVGNNLPLDRIPLGTTVHNIELTHGKGGQLARSAGASATLVARDGDYVTLRLPSGEMRMVFKRCSATIGSVGNEDHMNSSLGKAGRSRWLGKRPKVRGVVMNPVDHPHGGGEGRTSGGRHPVSPWGVPTKGYKTRTKRKPSGKFIVKRRK